MNGNSTDFAQLVTGFLTDHLPLQRCYSKNTILSYKDTLKLFVMFLTEFKGIRTVDFTMNSFNRQLVIDYLEWCRNRGSSISTANQRLAAMKTFAEYAQIQCIEYLSPLQGVQSIKSKKSTEKEVAFLTVEQVTELINKPDINTRNGLRHRTILTVLYDSGCRVQELCDLTIGDINVSKNPTIRLHGKGDKYRTIVVSENTAHLVSEYIQRQRTQVLKDQPLIVNKARVKMNRDGVNYIIEKYVEEICKNDGIFPKHVHAHMFRHSKAMHMLAAGINIVYIRDFLGHEDISTTMIYSRADNRLKNEAINKLAPKVTDEIDLPDWTKDQNLLDFLNAFK